MNTNACHVDITSFNLVKAITNKDLFTKISIKPVSRLLIMSLANMYNPKLGYTFPGIEKLSKCTGYTERQIKAGLKELALQNLIFRTDKKIYFTRKLYETLGIVEENTSPKSENTSPKSENTSPAYMDAKAMVESFRGNNFQPEQIITNNKHHVKQNFKNSNWNSTTKKLCLNELKNLLEGYNCVTNFELAKAVLNSMHESRLNEDRQLETIFCIQKMWQFEPEDCSVLADLEKKRNTDTVFKIKAQRIQQEIQMLFQELANKR